MNEKTPQEIYLIILSFLSYSDLQNLKLVNKFFNELSDLQLARLLPQLNENQQLRLILNLFLKFDALDPEQKKTFNILLEKLVRQPRQSLFVKTLVLIHLNTENAGCPLLLVEELSINLNLLKHERVLLAQYCELLIAKKSNRLFDYYDLLNDFEYKNFYFGMSNAYKFQSDVISKLIEFCFALSSLEETEIKVNFIGDDLFEDGKSNKRQRLELDINMLGRFFAPQIQTQSIISFFNELVASDQNLTMQQKVSITMYMNELGFPHIKNFFNLKEIKNIIELSIKLFPKIKDIDVLRSTLYFLNNWDEILSSDQEFIIHQFLTSSQLINEFKPGYESWNYIIKLVAKYDAQTLKNLLPGFMKTVEKNELTEQCFKHFIKNVISFWIFMDEKEISAITTKVKNHAKVFEFLCSIYQEYPDSSIFRDAFQDLLIDKKISEHLNKWSLSSNLLKIEQDKKLPYFDKIALTKKIIKCHCENINSVEQLRSDYQELSTIRMKLTFLKDVHNTFSFNPFLESNSVWSECMEIIEEKIEFLNNLKNQKKINSFDFPGTLQR